LLLRFESCLIFGSLTFFCQVHIIFEDPEVKGNDNFKDE
jgi:hypothetical protein